MLSKSSSTLRWTIFRSEIDIFAGRVAAEAWARQPWQARIEIANRMTDPTFVARPTRLRVPRRLDLDFMSTFASVLTRCPLFGRELSLHHEKCGGWPAFNLVGS